MTLALNLAGGVPSHDVPVTFPNTLIGTSTLLTLWRRIETLDWALPNFAASGYVCESP